MRRIFTSCRSTVLRCGALLLLVLFAGVACTESDADPSASPTADAAAEPVATATPSVPQTVSPTDEVGSGADATASVADISVEGLTCCGVGGEIDGEAYLFAMSLGGSEQEGHGVLHVLQPGGGDEAPREIGSLETPLALRPASLAPGSRIALAGDVLYLPLPGQDASGLWVVDVSDPSAPVEIALVDMELPPLSVVTSGDLAAVATMSFTGPFQFFDISDPSQIELVGEIEHPVSFLPPQIALNGSVLYILNEDGVDLIDVSNPDAPREAGSVQNPDAAGSSSAGDPPGLVRGIDGFAPPDTFLDMAVSEQYLYIAASDGGLRMIDVSDPDNPQEVGHLELPDRAAQVATADDRVAVLGVAEAENEDDGTLRFALHRIDASAGNDPQLVETVAVPDVKLPFQLLLPGEHSTVLLSPAVVHALEGGIDPTGSVDAHTEVAAGDPAGNPTTEDSQT